MNVTVPKGEAIDVLLLLYATDSPAQRAVLEPFQAPVAAGSVESTAAVAGAAATGTGKLFDAGGELYSFETVAPASTTTAEPVRLWMVAQGGVVLIEENTPEVTLYVGPVTDCSIRAGSVAAQAVGFTTCQGEDALGIVFPSKPTVEGSIRYFPLTRT